MTTPEVSTDAVSDGSKKYAYLGAALIATAFSAHIAAAASGILDAYATGRSLRQIAPYMLGLLVLGWVVARRRSSMLRAKTRLAVGTLLCLLAGSNLTQAVQAQAHSKQVARAYLQQLSQATAEHQANYADIQKRLGEIDLGPYLGTATLVSPPRLQDALALVARFRALLVQQEEAVESHYSTLAAQILTLPEGDFKSGAMAGQRIKRAEVESKLQPLRQVQSAHADALDALFSWGQVNASRLRLKDGNLVFQSTEQQEELFILLTALESAEERHITLIKEFDEYAAAEKERQRQVHNRFGWPAVD